MPGARVQDSAGPTSRSKSAPTVLTEHLRQWLGAWPPAEGLHVVGAAQRASAGWDGRVHPVLGVADDTGAAVLSVPPTFARAVGTRAPTGLTALLAELQALLGEPDRPAYRAVFRWTTSPADLPEPGVWVPADADGVPDWLRPFGGRVLVAEDRDGTHLAGVGIKRHNCAGHELSVVTAPHARGRGLAQGLVAQAARQVLREGAVPTYIHEHRNTASSRVADGACFPDRRWTAFGISERHRPAARAAHQGKP
jgi:GNAT superfamily N-acetyltransferase